MPLTAQSRRRFLGSTTAAGAMIAADLVPGLPRVSAAEASQTSGRVRFAAEIEPLVRLIEETPQDRLLIRIGERVHSGTSYQDILAALFLAGIRNVQPRPSVGFKFHAVLVVNSCHLASIAGPDADRWLPIFWGLDYFKRSQRDEQSRSGWQMQAVDEARVPSASRAIPMFQESMENWDPEQADVATAGMVRTAGATEVFNQFATYAARDFRSIGHKAIFLANAWRTLQVIGWDYAEPVMRSLAFALLNHTGDPNPGSHDLAVDRDWRTNEEFCQQIPSQWLDGNLDSSATTGMLTAFRDNTSHDAAASATEMLAKGVSAQSIWDGVFVGGGELLMRQPGIVGLHSLTTANALRFIWDQASQEQLRKRVLLQACSFLPQFRESARDRGQLADRTIERFTESDDGTDVGLESILEDISGDRVRAADGLYRYLAGGADPYAFIDQARRLIFAKGRDSHDYKFSSAVLEDFAHVSPAWQNTFLATSVFNLKGSKSSDNGLVDRTREALS